VYDDDLIANSAGPLETLVCSSNLPSFLCLPSLPPFLRIYLADASQVRVGMSIGHHPSVGSYKPDMKKDEADITVEDRQEAKRRIEGSLAPDGEGGVLHAPHFG
jgi:hypothetical protein